MKWKILMMTTAAALLAAGPARLAAQDEAGVARKYADRYTKETFDEADADRDGFVTWEEASSIGSTAEKARFARERFDAADADGDGRLSTEEARTLRNKETSRKAEGAADAKQRAGEPSEGSKARSARDAVTGKYGDRYDKETFDETDTDRDGFISWEEAKGASSQAERDLFGRKRFEAADRDGDGRLSPAEARALREKETSRKEHGSSKAKRRKGYGAAGSSGAAAASEEGRKRVSKRKRYEEASAKRQSDSPNLTKKQQNAKRRHRARTPSGVND
jgi:Ca2+-binding EF-hand superfamily protein